MDLPITAVPGRATPTFRWQQSVDTPGGRVSQGCEGGVPPSLESALADLITVAKRLMMENAALRGQVESLNNREDQRAREGQQRVAAVAPLKQPDAVTQKRGVK